METTKTIEAAHGLQQHGIRNPGQVHWTSPTATLYEHALRRNEGLIAHLGPLVASTGRFTGRTPKDKFVVPDPDTRDRIWWEGNVEFDPGKFDRLHERVTEYLDGKELWVQDSTSDLIRSIDARFA
jgi:phosphoenolpyruvate carboxykinase (ATP)